MSIVSEAIWAASPSTTRGQPTPLSSDNKGERIAYASNKSIFVRSIDTPALSKQYTGHTASTTVARFSPSGFYIASGDVAGTVRVWDANGAETTKGEYGIIAGRINDIAWDGDSQRIIAVGDGKERFGACITADSGNSVGEISGHNKQINCVSIRQQRPLRAATGSDDTSLCFFHGAPFKFNTSLRGKHDKFIYGTQFSPDGAHLVSVGSDRRIWLYDGKTGEVVKQIGEGEHKGSIFGVSWASDSKRLVTCSGDQTVKIWDVEAGKATQTWRQGEEGLVSVNDQQVGVTWPAARSDGLVISVDLEGNLNYFHAGTSSNKPTKVVRGHQKAITAAASAPGSKTFWTGSYDGRLRAWDLSDGAADAIDGEAHSNYVSGIAATADGKVASVGWDDTLRTASESQKSFLGSVTKVDGQPKVVAMATVAGQSQTLVLTTTGVQVYRSASNELVTTIKVSSTPTALAAHGATIAIGAEDKSLQISTLTSTGTSSPLTLKDATAPISTLAFSPDGTHLAAGLSNGKIFVFAASSSGAWTLETNRWSAHTARVTSISWSPDSKFAVSGGLDTNLFVWSLADPGKRIKAGNAHKEGIGAVSWVDEKRIVSAGADASVKAWKVDGLK